MSKSGWDSVCNKVQTGLKTDAKIRSKSGMRLRLAGLGLAIVLGCGAQNFASAQSYYSSSSETDRDLVKCEGVPSDAEPEIPGNDEPCDVVQANSETKQQSESQSKPLSGSTQSSSTQSSSSGQSDQIPEIEWEKRQGSEQRLTALGMDLMGDGIDPHTGSIEFSQTDVSIPGNFDLPVAITRKRRSGHFYRDDVHVEFGDWQIDVPRIHVTLPDQPTANIDWVGNRCTRSYAAQFETLVYFGAAYSRTKYANGLVMDIPGQGGKQILEAPVGSQWPTGTTHVTTDYWRLECLPLPGGQGFTAYAPNGDVYTFDTYIVRQAHHLGTKIANTPIMERERHMLAASQVRDVHGNTVNYTYDSSGRLTRIEASDGRLITLAYSGTLITSVTANGRTWTYQYGNKYYPEAQSGTELRTNALIQVNQPDGTKWTFDIAGMDATPGLGKLCPQSSQTLTITHPYGATGVFELGQHYFRTSYQQRDEIIRNECPNEDFEPADRWIPPRYELRRPPMMATTSKTITGPALPTMQWTYEYETDGGSVGSSGSDPTNWTKMVDPAGVQTTFYHFWTEGDWTEGQTLGGKLDRVEVRSDSGTLMQFTQHDYVQEDSIGYAATGYLSYTTTRPTHRSSTVTSQDGDSYTTTTTFGTNPGYGYSYGSPIQTYKSGVGPNPQLVEYSYQHDLDDWVLGLTKTVDRNGKRFDEYYYDAKGRVTSHSRFGAQRSAMSYYTSGSQAGRLSSVTLYGRQYLISNYKRGLPQNLTLPDGNTQSRSVDNNGWITSETDARGIYTSYSYVSGSGWLAGIDRPYPWADTSISYSGVGSGQIQQQATTGMNRETVSYDAFLRPVLSENYALDSGDVVYNRTVFDALGRKSFQSLPASSSTASVGTSTAYDALGRVISTQLNVWPYPTTTTDYLSNNCTRVTDPEGDPTTTCSSGYGSRDNGNPLNISQPEGVSTSMTYDDWGNLLSAYRPTASGGFTQTWAYDSRLRMCAYTAPETGMTRYDYNSKDEMIAYADGFYGTASCGALGSYVVGMSYDQMGRLLTTTYPSAGTKDITRSYDANGNLLTVDREGINWDYEYHSSADLLVTEALSIDAMTFRTTYEYNANQVRRKMTYSGGRTVQYDPDGLGRAQYAYMQAPLEGNIYPYVANHGDYHPNGMIASFSVGNGTSFGQSLDAAQRVSRRRVWPSSSNILDLQYGYNTRGQVTSITDNADPGNNRSFGYDDLGRLISANGQWGSGSYQYDQANNITQKTLGARTLSMAYNSSNRLASVSDSSAGTTRNYSHHWFGHLSNDSIRSYSYYWDHRVSTISGPVNASYAYDGHLRRVRQIENGHYTYTIYDRDGKLLQRFEPSQNGDGPTRTDYVSFNGETLARVKNGVISYTMNDHLGSPVSSTTGSGSVLWREQYSPYGEQLEDPTGNDDDQGFTGHIEDSATGLTYMQARFYDPEIGRFLQKDPVTFAEKGVSYFNRYAYVANDPVNATDPSGMMSIADDKQIVILPKDPSVPNAIIPNTVGAEGVGGYEDTFHTYDVRDAAAPGIGSRAGSDALRNNPTPGNDSPASTQGTLNDVGDIPGTPFDSDNMVKSFVVPPADFTKTTDIIINYTVAGEHALTEGFVMRWGELGPDGQVTSWRSYGEGNAWQQRDALKGLHSGMTRQVWGQNHQELNEAGRR